MDFALLCTKACECFMFTKELRVAGLQAKSVRPSKILVGNQYQGNFRTPFIDTFLSYSLSLSKSVHVLSCIPFENEIFWYY